MLLNTSQCGPIHAAEYLRMSTEHQQYSVANQRAVIREYAEQNNFVVTKSYTDLGRSGLSLRCREGLAQLLRDVVNGHQVYKVILVYDISRWGRFQDADEAAHYEYLCKKAGIQIHYCAENFVNDGTMSSVVMKALKRVMAAEYSRELSDKVSQGMRQMIRRGLWTGARPGFGLRRMLVSAEGRLKQVLEENERKNIKSDRIILVPGPPGELACVSEIYRMFVDDKKEQRHDCTGVESKGSDQSRQALEQSGDY